MMRTLGWIVLCQAVLAGFGLYFGWFSVSGSKANTDTPDVKVTFNKGKFKEDIAAVKEKVTGKSIEGQIRHIETARQELTIVGKQTQEETVKVDATTKIKIGDKDGSFGDLKIDDRVSVMYEATKEGNVAKSVAVSNKAVTDARP